MDLARALEYMDPATREHVKRCVVERDRYVQLLCLVMDIHRRLAAGRSIAPKDQDVFIEEGAKHDAPNVTEYIGAILAEHKAGETVDAYFKVSKMPR